MAAANSTSLLPGKSAEHCDAEEAVVIEVEVAGVPGRAPSRHRITTCRVSSHVQQYQARFEPKQREAAAVGTFLSRLT